MSKHWKKEKFYSVERLIIHGEKISIRDRVLKLYVEGRGADKQPMIREPGKTCPECACEFTIESHPDKRLCQNCGIIFIDRPRIQVA